MQVVFSAHQQRHAGRKELTEGELVPCFERPQRAQIILAHLSAAGFAEPVVPVDHGLGPIRAVHDPGFIDFLQSAHAEWLVEHGNAAGDALPTAWATHGLRRILPRRIDGRLGYYCFDAGTPIGPGTWEGAYWAAQSALHGVSLIGAGQRAAYALTRPPGHHAHRALYGGYCYLNNAAVAAQRFIDAGCAQVAVLDVDYHHGNGTQDIFYSRGDVLTVSLHADPRDSYPYFLGHGDETGCGAGVGSNCNLPLPRGTGWSGYAAALGAACDRLRRYAPEALVVSLGVDTYEGDPLSRFRIAATDFVRLGAVIGRLKLPTLFVQEGGYVSEALGENVVSVLRGFLDGC